VRVVPSRKILSFGQAERGSGRDLEKKGACGPANTPELGPGGGWRGGCKPEKGDHLQGKAGGGGKEGGGKLVGLQEKQKNKQ